jgi:hypothetical protein
MTVKIHIHGASSGGHFFKKYEVEIGDSTPADVGNGMVSSLRNYLKGLMTNGELTSGKITIDYTHFNREIENEEYHGLDTDAV